MAGDLQEAEVTKVAKCDFCEERHAFLYCKADSARLCLVCDHHVHSANPLSLKHARAPLCEYCKKRAATLQCEEETRFFCAACKEELGVHNGEGHTVSKSISFSGCILPGQLASAWKCQAPTSPFLEAFLSSKAVLDKACWTPDGSLSSILASHHWPNSLDSFLLSESNSCFADRSGSSNRYSGGQTAPKQVLLKQLEQLRRLQIEGDDFVAELQQECFRECMTHSSKQFCVPCDIVGGQTYADAQQQQEAADQHTFSYINSHPEQRSQSDNENSWNFSAEIKFPNTEVMTGYDSCKPSSDAEGHLLLQDANELSWTISPTSMLVGMENANLRSKEQIFSAPDSYMHKMDRSKPNSISGADVPVHANSSKRSPREASGTLCFNEDMPTSSVQVSDLQVQHKPTNGRSSGFLNSGASLAACVGTPPSLDTEASAQARDSAMMRYKEKKKTRKFEKFVRYESRKARAETRLRVRGRFVKANGFNYESSLAGGVG